MRRLVHLSDVHFGRIDPDTVDPIVNAVTTLNPDVVVVSGDLTQRAREWQFEEARKFLDRLPGPQIVVPGNHDVPLINLWARILAPLANYRKIISENVEPCFQDEEMVLIGVNTAQTVTSKGGRIEDAQIERVRAILCGIPENVTSIVVMHHPIDLPREYPAGALVGGAEDAVEAFATCGVDVFLSGHYHFGHTGDTAKRYPIAGFNALIVHAGTAISTRGRGQPNSFNVITLDGRALAVDRYTWRPEQRLFEVFTSEHFRYGASGWERRPEDTEPEAPEKVAG